MIAVKSFLDTPEPDDGVRVWIEPINLVPELKEMCEVHYTASHIGPPSGLRRWFDEFPECYAEFRARYHAYLARSPYKRHLHDLAIKAGSRGKLTLLHDGDNPDQNTATAMAEFLSELAAWKLE